MFSAPRKYGVDVGKKKKGAQKEEKEEETKRSRHALRHMHHFM